MSAILFGSISTVADTSELQRQSYNQAFEAHDIQWTWDQEQYRDLLAESGGQSRIAAYARSLGQDVDAQAVHETKSKIFQERLATADLAPRAGVTDTIKEAKHGGWKVGFVTTTSGDNITALLNALRPAVQIEDFDVIVDASDVDEPKPHKASYSFALRHLNDTAADCVAIEDNVGGVQAAVAAGLACVAFPNENTAARDLPGAARTVARLELGDLQQLAHRS